MRNFKTNASGWDGEAARCRIIEHAPEHEHQHEHSGRDGFSRVFVMLQQKKGRALTLTPSLDSKSLFRCGE